MEKSVIYAVMFHTIHMITPFTTYFFPVKMLKFDIAFMRVIYDVSYVSYADAYFLSETLSRVISIYDYVELELGIIQNIKSSFSVFSFVSG